jgi:hypothetical protein
LVPCATTSGAFCACDAKVASCVTVSADVASSTMRSFVMMSWIPGKNLGGKEWRVGVAFTERLGGSING